MVNNAHARWPAWGNRGHGQIVASPHRRLFVDCRSREPTMQQFTTDRDPDIKTEEH
jgi:hypothetical protein